MTIKVKKLTPTAQLPQRQTSGSAGADLCADITEQITIIPGHTVKIPTGIAIELPYENMAAFIFARSGLATNHGISPANCVGVADSDYRGEIVVALHNHSNENYWVQPQERIAQLVVMPVVLTEFEAVDELGGTERGNGGFGSTGKQ